MARLRSPKVGCVGEEWKIYWGQILRFGVVIKLNLSRSFTPRIAIQFWHHHSSSQEANTLFSNKFLELKGLRLEWRRTRPRLLIPPHSTTSYPSSSLASAGVLRRPSSVARQFPTRLLPIRLSLILLGPGSHGSLQRRFGRSSVLFGNRAMPSHWSPI